MLENIIKQQCEKYEAQEGDSKNQSIIDMNNEINDFLEKAKKDNKNLYFELDEIISKTVAIYGEEYFRAGFNDGLRLTNEIKAV